MTSIKTLIELLGNGGAVANADRARQVMLEEERLIAALAARIGTADPGTRSLAA